MSGSGKSRLMSKPVWLGLLLALATVAAYWPVYSAGFIWDDDEYVILNSCLHDTDGLRRIWFDTGATPQYYPIVHTAFWIEYHLWGLQPLGFHLVNVLLHVAGALLLRRILVLLKVPGAWLAAAIFALHPVEVESVAWITERKNVLSAFFYFLAALAYLKYLALDGPALGTQRRGFYYCSAFALFVMALGAKTVACSLPAALLLMVWWKKSRLQWRDVFPLLPFFLAGLGSGLLTTWLESHWVGAQGPDWSFSYTQRCLIAGRALFFYAAKLLWPSDLAFIYPRWQIDPVLWWQWLFPLAVVLILPVLWLARRKTGRGVLAALLFYCGTLFPALGFINIYPMRFSFVADHFQYLAGLGIIVLAAGAASRFFERRAGAGSLPAVLAALLLTTLGFQTWRQCHIYKDQETLWTDTIDKNPRCWMAHTHLGRLRAHEGKIEEAESCYLTALAINPENEVALYNYGNLLTKMGRFDQAEGLLRRALEVAPDYADAHNNLGIVLFRKNELDEAVAEYELAIAHRPDYADAYYNLSLALAAGRKTGEAVTTCQRAIALKPESELYRKLLGDLRSQVQPQP